MPFSCDAELLFLVFRRFALKVDLRLRGELEERDETVPAGEGEDEHRAYRYPGEVVVHDDIADGEGFGERIDGDADADEESHIAVPRHELRTENAHRVRERRVP